MYPLASLIASILARLAAPVGAGNPPAPRWLPHKASPERRKRREVIRAFGRRQGLKIIKARRVAAKRAEV